MAYHVDRSRATATACARQIARSTIEPLEARRLLSTINWSNRGADNFGIYGANAALARTLVDRAIDDWERVVVNFNYDGGGNTHTLQINAGDVGGTTRGVTSNIQRNNATQKKPISASITMDDNGGGAGWYLDPVPGTALIPDDSEFTTFVTPFDANMPGQTGFDFYRTALHEVGHAVGILNSTGFLRIGDFLVNSGVADPFNPSAQLRTINTNGGDIDYTLTETGGGHLFEGGGGVMLPVHPSVVMNPGRAIPPGTRRLITDTEATLLRDVYDYTITLPSQINTFYANLNTTTDVLTIRGENGTINDSIALSDVGPNLQASVNGSSELFPQSELASVLIQGAVGDDSITTGESLRLPVNVDAGNGNDVIHFDGDGVTGVSISGGAGNDTLNASDVSGASLSFDLGSDANTFNLNGGGVTVVSDLGAVGTMTVNINAGTLFFAATQHLTALNVASGASGRLLPNGTRVLVLDGLSILGSGDFDLNDNDAIIDYSGASQLAAIQALINSARNGGDWLGTGLNSAIARLASPANTTLAAIESADYLAIYPGATFAGESIDKTSVLVKYTYYGDADFNGVVNFDDYARIDAGFLNNRTGWLNGDFDGNGVVNFDDYSLIDLSFNTQTTLQARSHLAAAKPRT